MENEITNGEWRVDPRVTNGTKGWEIHFNSDGECITDHVYELADAKLIAASPNLLEAVQYLYNDIESWNMIHEDTQNKLLKALDKAIK